MAGENLGQPVSRAPGTRARGQREQVALLGCVCVCRVWVVRDSEEHQWSPVRCVALGCQA